MSIDDSALFRYLSGYFREAQKETIEKTDYFYLRYFLLDLIQYLFPSLIEYSQYSCYVECHHLAPILPLHRDYSENQTAKYMQQICSVDENHLLY